MSSVAEVFRLVRDIDAAGAKLSGSRRQQVLEDVRDALHADSVAIATSRRGDLRLHAVAGALPDAAALQRKDSANAIRSGRGDHFVVALFDTKPPDSAQEVIAYLASRVLGASECELAAESAAGEHGLVVPAGMVVGTSAAMRLLRDQIAAAAGSQMDVLLLGETGTGKELFARMIHDSGPSRRGPYIAINCAAIPGELLESELFGVHGRIATGVDPRPGLFARANGGTIVLDEIGDLPERLQAKLLRVLQEREILPLGASAPQKMNARVISASNRDLEALVATGQFRADLYYRLRGLEFHLPALRERAEDIPALVLEFARRAAVEHRKAVDGVSTTSIRLLMEYDWPGNVRELQTEVRRAVLLCPRGEALGPEHFTSLAARRAGSPPVTPAAAEASRKAGTLRERVEELERKEIEGALAAAGGNRSKAAQILGITRNGLALKMKRLRIGSAPPLHTN